MAYTNTPTQPEPTAEAVQAMKGRVLLEFGTDCCPHGLGAQDAIRAVLTAHDATQHIKIEDGPGRKLGRHFKVKLWPTLVVLRHGEEIGRVTRPQSVQAIDEQLPVAI